MNRSEIMRQQLKKIREAKKTVQSSLKPIKLTKRKPCNCHRKAKA